jgi:hypothetical protein
MGTFPANIRVVRQAPVSSFNEAMNWAGRDASPGGLVFAKRKRSIFKGPMLTTPVANGGIGAGHVKGSHSRSTSITGRRSGEIIEEEDEDEVEEVEAFTPLMGPDVEEAIYEDEEKPTPVKG